MMKRHASSDKNNKLTNSSRAAGNKTGRIPEFNSVKPFEVENDIQMRENNWQVPPKLDHEMLCPQEVHLNSNFH